MAVETAARRVVFSSLALMNQAPKQRSADWAEAYMLTDQAKRFSHVAFPHFAAPNGPFSAVDDPRITSIWLQFGSQLGKTFFGQTVCSYYADQSPCPMLFCSADQKLAEEGIQRLYRSLERNARLRDQLPPEARRRRNLVRLGRCSLYVAWARSVSTLADKAIKVAHGAEVDKWMRPKTSKEAHPVKLFSDRGKSFHHTKKFIFESTPTIRGDSRIEEGYELSDRRRFYVPCPLCHKYQILVFGDRKTKFGVKWDRDEHGKHHPSLAHDTAWYQCAHCEARLDSYHRWGMMQRGVWCPEGCQVDNDHAKEWFDGLTKESLSRDPDAGALGLHLVTGRPAVRGRDAGFHLSTLYSLSVNWGDIAEEYVKGMGDTETLRNFVMQWLALTWEKLAREQTWEQLAVRLIGVGRRHCEQGRVPPWVSLVTAGVDRQADYLVYVVKGWGEDRQNHTIDYGRLTGFEDLSRFVIQHHWPSSDGLDAFPTVLTLVDSGFMPDQIHEYTSFMRGAGHWVMPCRGTDRILHSPVVVDKIKKGPRTGAQVVFVESYTTQEWLDRCLYVLTQDKAGSMSIFAAPMPVHRNYLNELMNETSFSEPGSRFGRRDRWNKVDETLGNDYRDAERYAYAAMYVATYGGQIRPGQKFTAGPLQAEPGGLRIMGQLGRQ